MTLEISQVVYYNILARIPFKKSIVGLSGGHSWKILVKSANTLFDITLTICIELLFKIIGLG